MPHGVPGLAALTGDPSPELLRELLHEVIDPELGVDIVELGLLRGVTVRAGVARIRFTVTTPACRCRVTSRTRSTPACSRRPACARCWSRASWIRPGARGT